MGCDIHLFAERREGGAWKILPPPVGTGYNYRKRDELVKAGTMTADQYDAQVKAPYRFEHDDYQRDPAAPAFELSDYGDGEKHRSLADWFDDRNYRLFGMLAGVRNRDDSVQPIAEPRGVPADASPEYRDEVERWGPDGHSHTFFTVAELRTYFSIKMQEQFLEHGVLCGELADALIDKKQAPNCWSGDVFGNGIVVLPMDEYVAVRQHVTHGPREFPLDRSTTMLPASAAPGWFTKKYGKAVVAGYRIFVRACWSSGYNDDASRFLKLLDELETHGPADDIRVVCFFDN